MTDTDEHREPIVAQNSTDRNDGAAGGARAQEKSGIVGLLHTHDPIPET